MFERIAATLQPQKSVDKYAGAYEGKIQLATIAEGQELMTLIANNSAKYRKIASQVKSYGLIVNVASGGLAKWISAEQMLSDGFPTDKPIDLQLEIEQGAKDENNEAGNEELNQRQTVGQIQFSVFEVILKILTLGKDLALQSVFAEVDTAARVGSSSIVAAAAVAPPAAPEKAKK